MNHIPDNRRNRRRRRPSLRMQESPGSPDAFPQDELVERVVVNPLKRPTAAPDLTDSIMRRLGYARQTRRQARRAATIKWAQRAGLAAMALLAVYAASQIHSRLPQARQPLSPTLPAALQNDFRQHEQRLHQFINRIQNLTPPADVDSDPEPGSGSPEPPWTPLVDDPRPDASAFGGASFRWT